LNIAEIHAHLERESHIREKIRDEVVELEKKIRSMTGTMNKIHSTLPKDVPALINTVKPTLQMCRSHSARLAELVPPNQFWRWKELWAKHLQSAVFVAALIQFLESGTLLSLPDINRILGLEEEWNDRFYIQIEDYLHGLISLINELSRLAVNMVTLGSYDAPFRISAFTKDLAAGFSLLNLKNDLLRRRFDSIKYDLKKIEEVVYDVTLRNLNAPIQSAVLAASPNPQGSSPAQPTTCQTHSGASSSQSGAVQSVAIGTQSAGSSVQLEI